MRNLQVRGVASRTSGKVLVSYGISYDNIFAGNFVQVKEAAAISSEITAENPQEMR